MYKNILSSTWLLVVVILLSVVVGNYGIGRVTSLQAQISQAKLDQATLTQKLSTLQSVSAVVGPGSQSAASALPGKNPVLSSLSQIRSLGTQNVLSVSNLKSGSEVKDPSGLSYVSIIFDVTGARSGIISFLGSIGKIAPISLIDKVKLTEAGGQVQATIAVRSFWAAFPTTLPAVTENVTDLTSAERTTLTSISNLTQPQFVEIPAQASGSGKINPFAP
jgi:hypothetical protein